VKSLSFTSNFTPPMAWSGADLAADSPPNAYLKLIQPTIVVDTVLGRKVIAPYGVAEGDVWRANLVQLGLFAAGTVSLVGVLAYVVGRSRGRRGY
jgi:hypothetical protein